MILGAILVVILVLIDQITKLLANHFLTEGIPVIVIKNVLHFDLYYNSGASFGMLQGKFWVFMIITLVSLLIFGYFFTSVNIKKRTVYTIAVVLLIAGTLGNAIDRMRMLKVIDFIYMPILHTFNIIPSFIFNLADLYLNLGIVLFVIDLIFLQKKRHKKNNDYPKNSNITS